MTGAGGTELTAATVGAYLAERGIVAVAEEVDAYPLTGGVSNHTYWVEWPTGACVVKQARRRLAVQQDWVADVRRVIREGEAMAWLYERIGPPSIPGVLHLDWERMVLVMEAIRPPAENYKTILFRGEVSLPLAERFGGLLAAIHSATADDATRERFGDTAFFQELRLNPYYDAVAERHPDLASRLAELRRECLESAHCLLHGDYSPKNILVRDGEPILLDYETAHFGNPSFDVGFALTHLLCKALHFPQWGREFVAAARGFQSAYAERSALPAAATAHAGSHLAAIMLARMDGMSPLEYFTDERRKDAVRQIARGALNRGDATVGCVIEAVEARLG